MASLTREVALRYVFARRRAMSMSLIGIILGISFFIITQAQTAGFESFFIRTILGSNGAIRISDRFQDMTGTVSQISEDGSMKFIFNSREDARYSSGIDNPELVRESISAFQSVSGVSEILEGTGVIDTGSRTLAVEFLGIRADEHVLVSDLEDQIIMGGITDFSSDEMSILIGSRIAQRLNLKLDDRLYLKGASQSLPVRIGGVFETGVSQIDKRRIYINLQTARAFLGRKFGGSVFQVSIKDPSNAPQISAQMQEAIGHRVVSWQEREKVWLEVFRALRISSAITVSSILLLSGLGIFNVFAIMVIEKNRDIAILRSIGFTPADVAAIFLWQGAIVLSAGIIFGCVFGYLGTFGISQIPLRIRGIFSTDSFVVNWDYNHYIWASVVAAIFVSIASWIPARRASRIDPAKIIREAN